MANETKLANVINPQVMGVMINAKIEALAKCFLRVYRHLSWKVNTQVTRISVLYTSISDSLGVFLHPGQK